MTMELSAAQRDRARRLHREAAIITCHDHIPPPVDLEDLRRGGITTKFALIGIDAGAFDDFMQFVETEDNIELSFGVAMYLDDLFLEALDRTPIPSSISSDSLFGGIDDLDELDRPQAPSSVTSGSFLDDIDKELDDEVALLSPLSPLSPSPIVVNPTVSSPSL